MIMMWAGLLKKTKLTLNAHTVGKNFLSLKAHKTQLVRGVTNPLRLNNSIYTKNLHQVCTKIDFEAKIKPRKP